MKESGKPVQVVTMKGNLHNCVDNCDVVLAPYKPTISASGHMYNWPAVVTAAAAEVNKHALNNITDQ